ncbi:MAG: hypothetical protein PHS32_10500 [Rhodoferax sp.]|uniref:hypothetical protein n=1 Tax=Rhodoferax sp. TaxID=50421 RepID=UPI00261CD470|nr:hypothetical protein [Rhodoferax sp.]MDD5334165.1 hypothetical protein [Rhodoferax sp.]
MVNPATDRAEWLTQKYCNKGKIYERTRNAAVMDIRHGSKYLEQNSLQPCIARLEDGFVPTVWAQCRLQKVERHQGDQDLHLVTKVAGSSYKGLTSRRAHDPRRDSMTESDMRILSNHILTAAAGIYSRQKNNKNVKTHFTSPPAGTLRGQTETTREIKTGKAK